MAEKVGITVDTTILDGGKEITVKTFIKKRREAIRKGKRGNKKARSTALRLMSDFISTRGPFKAPTGSAAFEKKSAAPDVQGSSASFLKVLGVELERTSIAGGAEAFLELKQKTTKDFGITVTGRQLTRDSDLESSFQFFFGVGDRDKVIRKGKEVETFADTQIDQIPSSTLHKWINTDQSLKESLIKQCEQKFENFALIDYLDAEHGGKPVVKVLPGAARAMNISGNFKKFATLSARQSRNSKSGRVSIQIDVKLSDASMKIFSEKAKDVTEKFHASLGKNFSGRFITYALKEFNAAGKLSPTDYLESVISLAEEFAKGSNTPLVYKTIIKSRKPGTITQNVNIDIAQRGDEKRPGRFISKVQMTALVQRAVVQRMPKGPRRGPPLSDDVLTYRSGRFARSVQIALLNYKTSVIKFFYDPVYQVHEPTRSPSDLIESSIREVTQQLYGRQFNILRA